MNKKFELTDETIKRENHILYRIVALKDFSDVKKGAKGGWIEKEDNLSQKGDCWIYGNAKVYGDARVSGNAQIYNHAHIYGNAKIYGNVEVSDDAEVYGKAEVDGHAEIYGNAHVCGNAVVRGEVLLCSGVTESTEDYVVIGLQGSRPSHTTYHIPSDTVCTGCFHGTLEEFETVVNMTHKNNEKYLKQYKRIINIFNIYKHE